MALNFKFVTDASLKEFKSLPASVQRDFGYALHEVQRGLSPSIPHKHLKGDKWSGVYELIQNGSPAYRTVYCAKFNNTVYILHSFEKTTNGTDKHAMGVALDRYKEIPNR